MTMLRWLITGLLFALGTILTAQAQVTVDVAKINCDQFSVAKIATPEKIAIWLNGYYNGKRGNTVLDPQKLQENTGKVRDYCIQTQHRKMLLMDAVKNVLGVDKQ
jgi:hypothetical protein